MTEHLGREKHEPVANAAGNTRNGRSRKTLKGEFGELPIEIPRDRDGTFEPKLVPEHQTRWTGFDDKILSLYARGLTVREIQAHLEEMYDAEVSPSLTSALTDAVVDEVKTWQSRPLDPVYPIVYLDLLDGGRGIDQSIGGAGDDTYAVDAEGTSSSRWAARASIVNASSSYTLSENIEKLVLVEGSGAWQGAGNSGDNTLLGNTASTGWSAAWATTPTWSTTWATKSWRSRGRRGHGRVEHRLRAGRHAGKPDPAWHRQPQRHRQRPGQCADRNAGNNRLQGGQGADSLYGGLSDDYFIEESSADWDYEGAYAGLDTVERRYETNLLLKDNVEICSWPAEPPPATVLIGGAGVDTLVGEDVLIGGLGNDKYVWQAGSGSDVIDNTGGGTDWLFFNGIDRTRLSFHQSGDDLVILVDGDTAQQVRVQNHFQGGDLAISYLQPSDGYAIPASISTWAWLAKRIN
jgi:Ca2+-binding RTX toxin-like protein